MCLIAIAHGVRSDFPLVIAANRDESFARPAMAASRWDDRPDVVGGRDLLHGGSWLLMNERGRWAAVTNLRGHDRTDESRSRGGLVSSFVLDGAHPQEFATSLAGEVHAFGGFHLLAGVPGEILYLASAAPDPRSLAPGIHAFSNASPGLVWPKMTAAKHEVAAILGETRNASEIAAEVLGFLTGPSSRVLKRGFTEYEELESEPFVIGDRYGTRSSTVIVVHASGEVLFVERTFGSGGHPLGESRLVFELI